MTIDCPSHLFQMTDLFVLWLGEEAAQKVFTSLRLVLWSSVLSQLGDQSKSRAFLLMIDEDSNRTSVNLVAKLDLLVDHKLDFLELATSDEQQAIESRLSASPLVSVDQDDRLIVDIEHVDQDSLLKSSKETFSKRAACVLPYVLRSGLVRLPDDPRLFDKLHTFGKILDRLEGEIRVVHICDFQNQYQCESFAVLATIVHSPRARLTQVGPSAFRSLRDHFIVKDFLILAPAVMNDDRPTVKYDVLSVDSYLK